MIILKFLLWNRPKCELIQQIIPQQQLLPLVILAKHRFPTGMHTLAQLLPLPRKHQLKQFRDRLGVLLNLLFRIGIEDRQTSVDVPFIRVDAQRDVHFDILDAADVARAVPGELVVGEPGAAHAEEGSVRHGLRVGGDAVVLLRGQVDMLGAQAGHDGFNKGEVGVGGAVFD